jgi:hypothetical protein
MSAGSWRWEASNPRQGGMTTGELSNDSLVDASERRGLSRRQMIRASAVAGAAAWTAPVIIDSLSSPAAAGSAKCQGNKYYVKLVGRGTGAGSSYHPGDCYHASPLCNNTTQFETGNNSPDSSVCTDNDNYTWVCTSGSPPNNHGAKFPTFIDNTDDYTVTLASGCTFDAGSGVGQTDYAAVGNYNWTGSGGTCEAVTPTNANTVVFPKKDGSNRVLDYMYLEFVCT